MQTQIYSFRAPVGFVPAGVSTGAYIRGITGKPAGGEGFSWAITLMTVVLTVLPIILAMAVRNRELKKQLAALAAQL